MGAAYQPDGPAPASGIRFGIWLGIYLVAQAPMIWRGTFCGEGYDIGTGLFFMPCSLGMVLAIPLNLLPVAVSQAIAAPVLAVGLVAGYFGYAWNLYAILRASTRRRFSFLLLIHVTMVLANQGMYWQATHAIRA